MKIDKSIRTTINVTKAFKDELDKMKRGSETYEEILRREIGGFKGNLRNVKSPVAFTLMEICGESEIGSISVNWADLMKCNMGDVWTVSNRSNCVRRETATVIFRDEDVVLVKFKTLDKKGNIRFKDVEVVSYNFMSENVLTKKEE